MKIEWLRVIASLTSGVIFGFGVALSGMLDPARVQGFLDITGAWDPSLAFVLGGAVAVAMAGTLVAKRMQRPLLDGQFRLPSTRGIDTRLVVGSAIFGFGWGLGGFCPGPAVASTAMFVAFMLAGMILHDRVAAPKPA